MFLSKAIDLCALYDLHRKRSKEFQYSSISNKYLGIENIEEFYKTSPVDIQFNMRAYDNPNYKVGKFEYESSVKSGIPCNDTATGEAFINKNEDSPNVILVHGWRMDSTNKLKNIFQQKMMDLGWNMYYFSMPYHFDREPESSLYSGEYMISANVERTVEASQQAVSDLRALIHWK